MWLYLSHAEFRWFSVTVCFDSLSGRRDVRSAEFFLSGIHVHLSDVLGLCLLCEDIYVVPVDSHAGLRDVRSPIPLFS